MDNTYYIIRCAYKLLIKGKVSDAVVLLGHLVKHIEEKEQRFNELNVMYQYADKS